LREPAAAVLDERVLACAPVSPVARRAPGRGAWGHEPLAGAQVRLLAVTPTRVAVLSLDRDVGGPYLYRITRVEIAADRESVRGVRLGGLRPSRRLTIVLAHGPAWELEVSARDRRRWGPVVDELGDAPEREQASDGAVFSPDAPA
jgi:hypothetical protein